jgi:hypothetical protein
MMEEIPLSAQLHPLDPKTVRFAVTEGGYLSMTEGETTQERVRLRRALPYREPERYICVCDPEDAELGMIESVGELPEDQRQIVLSELKKLYYTPLVKKILSAKMRMGFMEFDVDTSSGRRQR